MLACFVGFVLGKPTGHVSNCLFFDSDDEIDREVKQDGDALEQLLDRSLKDDEGEDDWEMLMVTLESGKVYIGFATENLDPYGDRKYFRLLKVGSGHRNEDQEVEISTRYDDALKAFGALDPEGTLDPEKAEPFQTVIPKNGVAHASLFLPDIAEHLDGTPLSSD